MVYETTAPMSISDALFRRSPALQQGILQARHQRRFSGIQIIMSHQVQQAVDDVQIDLITRSEMMLGSLPHGGLGGDHDLSIDHSSLPLFQGESDDIRGAGIVHELLVEGSDVLVVDEAETDTTAVLLVDENELDQLLDHRSIEFHQLLEVLNLDLDG